MFTRFEFSLTGIVALLVLPYQLIIRQIWPLYSTEKRIFLDSIANGSVRNNVCIVTGSNTGIGKHTATMLAEAGATVILACRDTKRGEDAKADIEKQLVGSKHGGKVDFIRMDLSSLASIAEFCNEFQSKYDRLDILVNNAGLNIRGITSANLQQLFQVNYLGHYMLVRLLSPMMQRRVVETQPNIARVVNLSSVMHHTGQPDFMKSAHSQYSPVDSKLYSYYDDSKLYMNFLTMEINRRYRFSSDSIDSSKNRPIVAISVNPGAVRSDIWRHVPKLFKGIFDIVMRILFLSSQEGCMTSVYAAIMPYQVLQDYFSTVQINDNTTTRISQTDVIAEMKGTPNSVSKQGYKWCTHVNLPYVIPYHAPRGAISRLGCEMFGPFAYPHFNETSLPPMAQKTASQLWEYSGGLCYEIMSKLSSTSISSETLKELKRLLVVS